MPETLVAVHGNFASARWWQDLQRDPPPGWRVEAPDLPGFAGTPHAGQVSIQNYAAWLGEWLAQRHILRPVLLGHSLGGAVVMDYAARHPQGVRGLILAASAPLSGLVTPQENYPVLELLRSNAALLEMSLAALFPSGKPAYFADLLEDAARMAPAHYSGNARALSQWQIDPEAFRGLPVLVMGGELDALVTPELVRKQAALVGTQDVIFPGLGHGFPQEAPQQFRASLETFLVTLSDSGRTRRTV